MNKYTHPFFLGLAVILVSYFLNFMTVKPNESEINVKVTSSMKDYAFGGQPDVKIDSEFGNLFRGGSGMLGGFGVPRVLGVYYTIMFFLAIWGIIMYFFNPDLRDSNKRAIAIGIAGLFILNILIIMYEISYYEDALGITVGGLYKLTFGVGFYGLVAGLIAILVGAFKHFEISDANFPGSGIKLKPIAS